MNQPIAVVGVGAILPDAPDVATFWANIKAGRYSISDVPPQRWDPDLYYDPDPHAPDKTYSRIGGWVREYEWDPAGWRLPVPPTVSAQMEDGQKWSVATARVALLDAGWPKWTVDPERVAVIIGNAIGGDKHYRSNLRVEFAEVLHELAATPAFAALPQDDRNTIVAQLRASFLSRLPEITEDTMPGELANVLAGRVANLLNLRGPNFTTDAACASGLAALSAAVHGLRAGDFDAAVTGGLDRNMNAAAFVKFCKIGALSATGTRPFDAGADGFVMGEGAALFVLRRLADAERDGNRIYAVLLGIGGSSDGRGKGITAPNPIGQRLAVERAWQTAGLDPALASTVEAHGTSTRVGDATELESLTEIFGKAGAEAGSIALGSVKSNIGHLKGAAGAAGLLKTVLSLHEKVLAPSLNFHDPNPNVDWDAIPFRVNRQLREWPAPPSGVRCAGLSAFGFGGTNFHVVTEEYVPGRHRDPKAARSYAGDRPATVKVDRKAPLRGAAVVGGQHEAEVASQLDRLAAQAASGRTPAPQAPDPALADAAIRVAIDYADAADLAVKAGKASEALRGANPAVWRMLRTQGIFLGRGAPGPVAFLYTGQGSQYANMARELERTEPIVAATFAEADRIMTPLLGRPLSAYIFAQDADPATAQRLERQLMQTEITQPAVLATDLALTRLLDAYGVQPDFVMGHSLGEYGALVAAGALSLDAALEAVSARGQEMASLAMADNGAMAAVFGPMADIERIVASVAGYVVVANINSNSQAVIGGATDAVQQAIEACQAAGLTATRIPVSHAFHTSIVAPASEPLKIALRRLDIHPPVRPIVSNVTGEFYPPNADVETMLDLLGRQVAAPVQFVKGLRTLYAAGARIFVEVGPKKALHGFTENVLGDDVLALYTNHPKIGDVASFNQALCGLYAAGLALGAPVTRPAPVTVPEPIPMPVPAVTVAPPPAVERTAVSTDRYAELGRLVADVIENSLRIASTAGLPAPATSTVERVSEPVVITGAALGLPGVARVFDDGNVARILSGQQFIDTIPSNLRQGMVDRHITRLVKRPTGDPSFETIEDVADVIKLAGRGVALDVVNDFGVDPERDAALDVATRLAIGAGFDALRDAGIPLVLHYRTTTLGTQLPDRWGLPDALRDDTGVIFASAFPGYDNFGHDLERYFTDRGRREQLAALQAIRSRLRGDEPAVVEVDRRINELGRVLEADPYTFDRRFLFRCLSMGHSQFAELIGARGPNTQVNAACASTTQALCLAEDWIRAGRCRRVVVVSADDVTSDTLLPWLASGFLASGAAATDEAVEDAATPFDRRRHGMIVGMGAAGFVVESAEAARERGLRPICEVLGAVTANSAYHGTRLDVGHIGDVMERVMAQAEARGVNRREIAPSTVFVSHETYTPARGGSAAAEINALRHVFGPAADAVVITNTKAFTGHAMGAGIEDVVAIKALETGLVPPVPNFKEPDPELGELNLSTGGAYPVHYALRLAAGFGSQVAMSLVRWTPVADGRHRAPGELGYRYRIADAHTWRHWLAQVTGTAEPVLEVVQRRLRVADGTPAVTPPAPEPVHSVQTVRPEPVVEDTVPQTVLEIVSGLTGYPPELLELDLDLEADLGVDTVKQAEVFAAVRERYAIPRDDALKLRDFPTLQHVITWIRERRGQAQPAAPLTTTVAGDLAATGEIVRRVPVPSLRPDLAATNPTGIGLDTATRVVVVPDQGSVGDALVNRLGEFGVTVFTVDPDDPATELDAVMAAGPVHGVYWLPALDDEGELDGLAPDALSRALGRRVRALYTTMRKLYDQTPFLVTATRLGGYHGYDEAGATCPLGGAVTGFAKAYKRERPAAVVKAVDVAVGDGVDEVVDALVEETRYDPGCVEVGYANGRRWGVGLIERAFGEPVTQLDPDTVFLVTGAAGSIVSAITADLATASGGTFHLFDLTPAPESTDADLRRYLADRDGFKTELAGRLRERGDRPTPVLIERELAQFERLSAALAAVQAVERAGGKAFYHCVDLTDATAVDRAVAEVRAASGRVDVLVHAAGVEISHTLPDKLPAEFDLVLGVKGQGLCHVLRALQDVPLGTVVAFSSVAGRFGNVGQTDYSAANDLQSKVLSHLRRSRPSVRTLTVDWTAWGGIGMATRGSIPKIMEMAGVELLPPEIGVAWVRRELLTGVTAREVVVAGRLGALAAGFDTTGGLDPSALVPDGPMASQVVRFDVHDGLVVSTTLDPKRHRFLDDHRIDGTAVLPGVMGLEAFAEVASLLGSGWRVASIEQVDFRSPVKFYRDEPRTLTVTALVRPDGHDLVAECRLEAERTLPGLDAPQRTVHFTGSVRLTARPRRLDEDGSPVAGQGSPELRPAEVYRLYFHGPAYQVIEAAWRQGDTTVARMRADLPAASDAPTRIAPRVVELCFQTAGLWEAGQHGRLALPWHIDVLRLTDPPTERAGLVAVVRPDATGGYDCSVRDASGLLIAQIDGYRTIALPDEPPADVLAPIASALRG
jgi:acyl transferase domain-containing protein/NADP-dependent 3-hydroxy acid dehydrogenase YdfG